MRSGGDYAMFSMRWTTPIYTQNGLRACKIMILSEKKNQGMVSRKKNAIYTILTIDKDRI